MFEIQDRGPRWAIVFEDGEQTGSFDWVIRYALRHTRVKFSEIEHAVNEMILHGHDTAHFGVMHRFMFTAKSSELKFKIGARNG